MNADRRPRLAWRPSTGGVAVAGITVLLLAARAPLHLVTWSLPVSNDDAIPLLMARHVLGGELSTILWNQPYNGTLDTYLLAPFVAVAGHHAGFRLYEIACGALLVAAIAALAFRVAGAAAAVAAGALAAAGTPYMALMAATGPTPNFLVPLLVSVPVFGLLGELDGEPASRSWPMVPLLGLVLGLVTWDSMLAVPAFAGAALGLLAAGWRPAPRDLALFGGGLVAGLSPLAIARVIGASASSPVTDLRPRWLWTAGGSDLLHAAAGLFGLQVPLVVDGPERAALPAVAVIALAVALAASVLSAVTGPGARRTLPLAGWAALLAAGFALSRRTGADEVRYLYGLTVPVLVLAGTGIARLAATKAWRAAALALGISVPWLLGEQVLARTWRDPEHASRVWQVPPLDPLLASLRRAGVTSAYASLQIAGRLALESGESIRTSQAWNERIPGDPLRFRDEVDLDPRAAWVLSSRLSRGMPRAGGFRDLLGALGGQWHEDVAAEFSVFRAFRPPYDESRPVPAEQMEVRTVDGGVLPAAVRDRDASTGWVAPRGIARGSGLVVRIPPRRLSALVLLVPLDPTPLATSWVCEVDGAVVASGPRSHTLQWVNGAPRAGRQALLTVILPGTRAGEVRLLFQDDGPPLGVHEVFLYGPDETPRPAAGASAAEEALAAARRGDWDAAVRSYGDAVRAEPDRASYHSCLVRARWRARGRRRLDVESLGDGGPALVERR